MAGGREGWLGERREGGEGEMGGGREYERVTKRMQQAIIQHSTPSSLNQKCRCHVPSLPYMCRKE